MYISQTDIENGIYPEYLQVLSRNPENIETAIKEAISEVRSYLCTRYDIDTELVKTGTQRNDLIVKFCREIALYNCYSISNPVNMPEIRVQKYKDTINSLKDIQREKANITGLTRLSDAGGVSGSNALIFGGNTKRKNSY